MEERTLTIIKENGDEMLCTILFTFHYDETGLDYVVFETPDEEVMAATYVENEATGGELNDIETDAEWAYVEEMLNQYYDSLEEEEDDIDGE